MFWKRFFSGAVILGLTVLFGSLGGPFLALALGVLSSAAYLEYTKASKVREEGHRVNGFEYIGVITIFLYYVMLILYSIEDYIPNVISEWLFTSNGFFTNYTIILLGIFTTGVICILCIYIFWYPKFNANQVAGSIFGLIYTTFMMSFIYYTRESQDGVWFIWVIFITSWVSDTCAYFVGSAWGKHKMTPRLSPKKSWEGAVGGIIGSGIATSIFGLIYEINHESRYLMIPVFFLIGCIGAFISMCGDLVASAVKRNNNVKDFGNVIPGHGGILDRFDSVLFTAPTVYFMIVLFLVNK
ncbi:MAG: phosphatidate cytidylyltransferase [Lachnospiraceae bacterium]|nr:phosphatidate cytidylyltransferase [Lachnospiraceae bacterium]